MLYQDRIYGAVEITEPVILALIASPSLQRLKGIDQGGYFEVYWPGTKNNRFEHSLGVYLLLKKYQASLEEQIAGLLHDVSHSVFSHVIDYVLAVGSQTHQTHQDNIFEAYIRRSEIPGILAKHHINLDYILDENNFPLLETKLPDLCADRLDYSLKGLVFYRVVTEAKVQQFIQRLIVKDRRWLFTDFATAKEYAEDFLKINDKHYSGIITAVMFKTVGDYLRYALQRGYITEADLYTTDDQVLEKIRPHHAHDPVLQKFFARMNNQVQWENNPNDHEARIFCKSRIVDPRCFDQGEIKKVSEIDPSWSKVVSDSLRPKEYFLKFHD